MSDLRRQAVQPVQFLPLQVRPVSPHATHLHEHLGRLTDGDRRLRLGRAVAHEAIEAFCTRGRGTDPIILGGFCDGRMIASAELSVVPEDRFGLGRGASKADLLIAVEPACRRRGLALQLARAMLQHAALKRIALVRMTYDPANLAMMRLTAALGAVHGRAGQQRRAELCTGWIGESFAPIAIEPQQRFRPLPTG